MWYQASLPSCIIHLCPWIGWCLAGSVNLFTMLEVRVRKAFQAPGLVERQFNKRLPYLSLPSQQAKPKWYPKPGRPRLTARRSFTDYERPSLRNDRRQTARGLDWLTEKWSLTQSGPYWSRNIWLLFLDQWERGHSQKYSIQLYL